MERTRWIVLLAFAAGCEDAWTRPVAPTVAPPWPTAPGAPAPQAAVWGWPSLTGRATVAADGDKDAAVVVAIENYAYVPKIPGATQNGADWYRFLVEDRKVPIDRVSLLTNDRADKEGIVKELKRAAAAVDAGGTLWFVFIGHGAPLQLGGKTEGVLIGEDTKQNAESLEARSVAQSEVARLMDASKAAHKVAVLDACFSGRSATGAVVPGLQPLLVVRDKETVGAVTWLSAGSSEQFAGPLPGADRPAFSYLVLGALRGWASENGATVTAKAALDYARKSLAVLEPMIGRAQTPELAGPEADFALARGGRDTPPNLAAMLASSALTSVNTPARAAEPAPVAPPRPVTPTTTTWSEDFSRYAEGDAAPEWGTDTMIMKDANGRKFLAATSPGAHRVSKTIAMGTRFVFEFTWTAFDHRENGTVAPWVRVPIVLRDASGAAFEFSHGNWGLFLPGRDSVDFSEGRVNRFRLERIGNLFKFYHDDQLLVSAPYPGFGPFVEFEIVIPVANNRDSQWFTNFAVRPL